MLKEKWLQQHMVSTGNGGSAPAYLGLLFKYQIQKPKEGSMPVVVLWKWSEGTIKQLTKEKGLNVVKPKAEQKKLWKKQAYFGSGAMGGTLVCWEFCWVRVAIGTTTNAWTLLVRGKTGTSTGLDFPFGRTARALYLTSKVCLLEAIEATNHGLLSQSTLIKSC